MSPPRRASSTDPLFVAALVLVAWLLLRRPAPESPPEAPIEPEEPMPPSGVLAGVRPELAAAITEIVNQAGVRGVKVRAISGYRSPQAQDALYAQGRSVPGPIVTYARGGESAHNWGAAVDVWVTPDTPENWTMVGELGEQLGLTWGGRWLRLRDLGHLELSGWKSLRGAA